MKSETKVALQVVFMIVALAFLAERIYWFGVQDGGEITLKACQNGHPACMAPHTHPVPSERPRADVTPSGVLQAEYGPLTGSDSTINQ